MMTRPCLSGSDVGAEGRVPRGRLCKHFIAHQVVDLMQEPSLLCPLPATLYSKANSLPLDRWATARPPTASAPMSLPNVVCQGRLEEPEGNSAPYSSAGNDRQEPIYFLETMGMACNVSLSTGNCRQGYKPGVGISPTKGFENGRGAGGEAAMEICCFIEGLHRNFLHAIMRILTAPRTARMVCNNKESPNKST